MKSDVAKIAIIEIRSENLISTYTIKIYKYFNYYYYRVDKKKAITTSGTIINRTITTIYRITNLNLVTIKDF